MFYRIAIIVFVFPFVLLSFACSAHDYHERDESVQYSQKLLIDRNVCSTIAGGHGQTTYSDCMEQRGWGWNGLGWLFRFRYDAELNDGPKFIPINEIVERRQLFGE